LIRPARSTAFLEEVAQLPIRVERIGAELIVKDLMEWARRCRLSGYDANYLDLAPRESLPIATADAAA
jgi:predicted nucleic acid-binding protein